MLKLRDFLHLPQVDLLISQLVAEQSGLVVLAGIDARPIASLAVGSMNPSGLSALFNILMQEILLARPLAQAVVISPERTLARVPRQLQRRVRHMPVDSDHTYAQQTEMAANLRPSLLVVDHLNPESAPAAFRAAQNGALVLSQVDTVLRGARVAHQFLEMGVPREMIPEMRWILTNQRMSVLCSHCRQPVKDLSLPFERLLRRYPHLGPVLDQLKPAEALAGKKSRPAAAAPRFYRAGSCERCHGTGYSGDISVFDIFYNRPEQADFFEQPSLLSLEEYAMRLALQGELDLDDLLDLESDHLQRTYQMLTASEKALTQANTELSSKLLELEASNRVLVQRTEVLISLQDMGQALISSTDLSDLAARICRRAGELCGADRVVLYLRRAGADGVDTAAILAVRGWDTGLIGQQVEMKELTDMREPTRTIRYTQLPPGMTHHVPPMGGTAPNPLLTGMRVPLIAQDHPVGVMLIQSTQKNAFTPGETALLQTFANQAALAIQRAGLVEELKAKIVQLEEAQAGLVKKERMERELELARQVQQSMLPHSFPEVPGYAVFAHYEPARQVGGDFYDIIRLDDDHFGIVIADVADKGMPAALYMALTRSLLLAEARRVLSPREVLRNVNHLLCELAETGGFVSIFYGIIEYPTGLLTYTRAGHERPLLVRGGAAQALGGEGAVLGILDGDDLNLSEESLPLTSGDRLILYTDGLTDVIDTDGKFSGLTRLRTLLEANPNLHPAEICGAIFEDLSGYRGLAEQFDDMTLLVLEVK